MVKIAIGLFENAAMADKVVAHLLQSGVSRGEVKLLRGSDFDGGPETYILKLAGLLQEHAGRYWKAVRGGDVLVAVTSGGDTADRAADFMDQHGALEVEEPTAHSVESGAAHVATGTDLGLYPRRRAAQLFEVS